MLQELENVLRPLLGATVEDAAILVWPGNEGRLRLSSDLFLSIETKTGQKLNIIISTQPDGQTPSISEGNPSIEYSYDAFAEHLSKWTAQRENLVTPEYHQIGFRLVDSRGYRLLNKATITAVLVICSSDDSTPVGIKISFSSNHAIYSVAGVSGNIVFDSDEYPKNFFPFPVQEIEVNDQRLGPSRD